MRDDVYLVIIFVLDEDDGFVGKDCVLDNSDDGWNNVCISYDDVIKLCKYFKFIGEGKGKLGFVFIIVNMFKFFKIDLGWILIVSIVGDFFKIEFSLVVVDKLVFKDF